MLSVKAIFTAWALIAQILQLSTLTLTQATQPTEIGSCIAAGFVDCCTDSFSCKGLSTVATQTCSCDFTCHVMGDCCEDIDITCPNIPVEMRLRRDTFIVFEDDPGFDSSVLIFVDIVVIRNPTINQQMVDLDYTVSSTATRGVDYQIQTCTMDPGLGSGSGLSASGSGSGLSGSGSGSGLSGSGSGSGGSGSGYQIQSSVFCLNVTIFGDDIVEDVEYISVNFVPLDDQVIFIGPSETQVHIVDNDGVQLIVPDQLTATEGERQQLCVTIQEDGAARERSVGITFELFPADTSDAAILTTNAEIPVGSSSVCVYIVAYDDSIAEFNESVLILARPNIPLDFVNQLTTLLIIDDDGVDLVVRPSELNLMEGDVMEVCVEFAEGQIPAERVVILTVSENFGTYVSIIANYCNWLLFHYTKRLSWRLNVP